MKEITHVHIDAGSTKTTGILVNDGLALWTNLESIDVQMWELQTSLD